MESLKVSLAVAETELGSRPAAPQNDQRHFHRYDYPSSEWANDGKCKSAELSSWLLGSPNTRSLRDQRRGIHMDPCTTARLDFVRHLQLRSLFFVPPSFAEAG